MEKLKIQNKEFDDPPMPRRCKRKDGVLDSPKEWKNTMATIVAISNSTESSQTRNISNFFSSTHDTTDMKTPMYQGQQRTDHVAHPDDDRDGCWRCHCCSCCECYWVGSRGKSGGESKLG